MGEIVIEEMNYKAFVIALANVFAFIASIAIAVYGFREDKMRFWLPGLIAAFTFFISSIIAISKAAQVKKLMTITRDGIIDSSTNGGIGFVSFEDIKEFIIINVYNKRAIALIPKNIDVFLSKLSATKRRQVKRNISMDLPPVTIFVDLAKDMEPEDILSLLQKRLSDYSRLYE